MSLPCCYRSETNPDGCDFRRHKTSPLCLHHLFEVIRDAILDDMMPPDAMAELRAEMAATMIRRYGVEQRLDIQAVADYAARVTHEPLVYYIRLSRQRIKIGTTRNLPQRMAALRATRDDLIAVEPGGRAVERDRHRQFSAVAIPGRSEEFYETADLLAWAKGASERHAELAYVAMGA